jgi:two-component system, OmpR family, response regulator
VRLPPVALVAWPIEAALRDALAARGQPRLLVVAEGHQPPACPDCLEDWVQAPVTEEEMRARIATLRARAESHLLTVPELDEEGFLHFGSRSVYLPPVEARLARALVERFGRVVSATTLVRAAWPEGTSSRGTLDVRISRLRRRLADLDLMIRTIRQRGWMLEAADRHMLPTAGPFVAASGPGERHCPPSRPIQT